MQTTKELYKAHTEHLTDDLDFYYDFCQDKPTLELFAGYGRLTNRLLAKGCDIETVEIDPFFSNYIELPAEKNHTCDVRKFSSRKRFDRVFAAYNSFPLLITPDEISRFFINMSKLLKSGGQIALNVYHPDWWENAVDYPLTIEGKEIYYTSGYNLDNRSTDKLAQWFDYYKLPTTEIVTIEHKVRLYESSADFLPFLEGTDLKHFKTVMNFARPENELVEPGWCDYIFVKQG